jgi:hypothetical protein
VTRDNETCFIPRNSLRTTVRWTRCRKSHDSILKASALGNFGKRFSTAVSTPLIHGAKVRFGSVISIQITIRFRLEVAIVKVVHTHETVLATGCIADSCRMHSDSDIQRKSKNTFIEVQERDARIDGPKVTFHPPYFFLKDFVPESCLKFTLP